MRVFNLTFAKFPAKTAEAIYVKEISRGFTEHIGRDFLLIVGNNTSHELENIPYYTIAFKRKKYRTIYYFFWIPYFILYRVKAKRGANFFSNDQFLLASLIIWKKILHFKSSICADWHMFSGTWKDRFIAQNATVHICTTEHLRMQIIKELNANPDSILTVHGGVDENALTDIESKSNLRSMLKLPADKILIGYVGLFRTLKMEKGIGTMIKALSLVARESNVHMVFVGAKGDEITFYENIAQEQNVSDRCTFIAMVTSEKVLQYQKAMDMLVIPYPDQPHYRKYGFPMKVYEYMASGVPVLYSNLPIIDEVLSGFARAFTPDDPQSLAYELSDIIKNQGGAQHIAQKAKEKAKEYTWKEKAKTILQFISSYEK